jgi:hypothetical protein
MAISVHSVRVLCGAAARIQPCQQLIGLFEPRSHFNIRLGDWEALNLALVVGTTPTDALHTLVETGQTAVKVDSKVIDDASTY